MARKAHTGSRDPQTLRLLGAGGLLLLYLLDATPAAPALFALVGGADRSHQVLLHQTASGTEIVFHHGGPNFPAHRHGLVARALTALALPDSPAQPDHVVQFGNGGSRLQHRAPTLDPRPPRICGAALARFAAAPEVSGLTIFSSPCSRPPPASGGLAFNVRFTVLLI